MGGRAGPPMPLIALFIGLLLVFAFTLVSIPLSIVQRYRMGTDQ